MQIERLNEDTLKVTVDKHDLIDRGLNVIDLLGDQDKIQSFFLDILNEADEYNEFRDDESSLTFQVLPSDKGLEIFIKKNDLDSLNQPSSVSNEIIEDWRNQHSSTNNAQQASADLKDYSNSDSDTGTIEKIIEFSNFEEVIKASHYLYITNGASNLYLYRHHYYLDLLFFLNINNVPDSNLDDELAIAYEYGHHTDISPEILNEHGKKVMETSAIELIRHYFK